MSYRYENLYIMHYGVGHDKGGHSGRYPWGSGERPYGGVNPKTKKSDLFKLNGRRFNDVASDLIVKKKYGNRTDVTEEQIAASKARTEAFLRGLESTIGVTIASAVGNISLNAITAASQFDKLVKDSEEFTKNYVSEQTGLLNQYRGAKDRYGKASFDVGVLEGDLNYNRRVADMTPLSGRGVAKNGLKTSWETSGFLTRTHNDDIHAKNNVITWDNATIKTFENDLKNDFSDFEKQWKETNDKINSTRSKINASKEYWDELEFNSKKNNW